MESTDINKYMLNKNYISAIKSNNICYNIPGLNCTNINKRSDNIIDNESYLLGIKNPTERMSFRDDINYYEKPTISDNISYDSRQSITSIGDNTRSGGRACNTLSGITIDRFEYPHISPQQHLYNEDIQKKYGSHSRNYIKDCYTLKNMDELKIDSKKFYTKSNC